MQALINYYQIFAPKGTRSATESGTIHRLVWTNGVKKIDTDSFLKIDTPEDTVQATLDMLKAKIIAYVKKNGLSGGDKWPIKKDDVKFIVLTENFE